MSARYPWWMGVAAWAGAGLLRLLANTWRVDLTGVAELERRAPGEGCIYALWHSGLLPLTVIHRDRDVAALISRHRDGELIARVVEKLGYRTARGSSTRGGGAGMKGMIDHALRGHRLAVTPDGPRGPAEILKPGVIGIASASGKPVWPIAAAARSTWVLASWDRMRIPRPFARVVVAAGEPLRIPPGLGEAEIEVWRGRLEAALRDHTAAVRARAGEPAVAPMPGRDRVPAAADPDDGEEPR